MRFRRFAPPFMLLSILISACDLLTGLGLGSKQGSWRPVPLDSRVTDAYTGFGFELFRRVQADDPGGNLFVSPTSAALALAMIYNGTAGSTADEMARALGLGQIDRRTINENNRLWVDALTRTGDPLVELDIANSVWYREGLSLLDSFRDEVATHYDAELRPMTTAEAINAWVSRATRGRIEEIVTPPIPAAVVAYLVNALYFRADWTYQFDRRDTHDRPFHLRDGSTVTVPMMARTERFETRSDQEMVMLRLPYGTGRFSMILALPRDERDLGTIAERLESARWREWMSEFSELPELRVVLPKFEIEWEASLVETLGAMGMESAFDAGTADFSAMVPGGGVWIDELLQKTYLRVDEEGTEAAAVTSGTVAVSGPPSIEFDRPFFLAIHDHATETVLFLGQINDPS